MNSIHQRHVTALTELRERLRTPNIEIDVPSLKQELDREFHKLREEIEGRLGQPESSENAMINRELATALEQLLDLYRMINVNPPVYGTTNQQTLVRQYNLGMAENVQMGLLSTGHSIQLTNSNFERLHYDNGQIHNLYDEMVDHNTKIVINIARKFEDLKLLFRSFPDESKISLLNRMHQLFIFLRPLVTSYTVDINVPVTDIRGENYIIREYEKFVEISRKIFDYIYGDLHTPNIRHYVDLHNDYLDASREQINEFYEVRGYTSNEVFIHNIMTRFINDIKEPIIVHVIYLYIRTFLSGTLVMEIENLYERMMLEQYFDEEFNEYMSNFITAIKSEIRQRENLYTELYGRITNTIVHNLSDPFYDFMWSNTTIDPKEAELAQPTVIPMVEPPEQTLHTFQHNVRTLPMRMAARPPSKPSKIAKKLLGFANPKPII